MSVEIIAIVVLCGILVLQQFYWAFVCYNLVNRLMSKNYFEYTQGKNNLKPLWPKKTHQQPNTNELVIDPEDDRQAKDMNSLMGMV